MHSPFLGKALLGWTAFSQRQLERARNSYTEIQLP